MPSASCCLFACFLLRRKSIPNGVQMQQNFLEIFSGPEDTCWAKKYQRGAPRGAQPTRARLEAQARPSGLCSPRSPPSGTSMAYRVSSGPEKISKKFRCIWTPFVLIFYKARNKQKIATGTGHYVNRLVPKNGIKLL